MEGKQVRLFLTEGTPGGLLTAEIMNWTGQIVAGARSDLAALLSRVEVGRTGVYFLTGVNEEDPDESLIYVGEGDDVGSRLKMHHRSERDGGKDFWTRALILTSKDANLTKAHARYLESRFIELGTKYERSTVVNKTAPAQLPLPEADISDMEYFISQARIILPLLGVEAFRDVPRNEVEVNEQSGLAASSPPFTMSVPAGGGLARGQEVDGEFIVYADSAVRSTWVGARSGYWKLYERLRSEQIIGPVDGAYRFLRSHAFKSPSAAAAIVSGRPTNGRTSWRTPDGMTYAAWQERTVPPPQVSAEV